MQYAQGRRRGLDRGRALRSGAPGAHSPRVSVRPLLPLCAALLAGTVTARGQAPVDPALAHYIAGLRAIDNHAHPMRPVAKGELPDTEYDALPLDGIPPFPLPWRLTLDAPPATLDDYVTRVVVPALRRQREAGAVAIKFEAAYLRALDFDSPDSARAAEVYARYAAGGAPSPAEYKALADVLFRIVAREAGRLGLAVHLHVLENFGGFYQAEGARPGLLESALNDSPLPRHQ